MAKLTLFLLVFTSFAGHAAGYLSLAAKGGFSHAKSADGKNIEDRKLNSFGGELLLGLTRGRALFGVSGEYLKHGQIEKVSKTQGSNLGGTQLTASPAVGIALGRFLLLSKLNLYSTYKTSEKSQAGETVTYESVKLPSYGFQLMFRFGLRSFIGVEYAQATYAKINEGGSSSTFKADDRVVISSTGIIYGLKF